MLGDSAPGGWFGLAGIFVTTAGVVIVALLSRSTRAEARNATDGVVALALRLDRSETAHEECEARLSLAEAHNEWADSRIADLEKALGLPRSARPHRRTRGDG